MAKKSVKAKAPAKRKARKPAEPSIPPIFSQFLEKLVKEPKEKEINFTPEAEAVAEKFFENYIVSVVNDEDPSLLDHLQDFCRLSNVFAALKSSVLSIAKDTELPEAAKMTMIRSSFEGFIAALEEVNPEILPLLKRLVD